MAPGAEQDQCREGSTTTLFSSGLCLMDNMVDAGVHMREVLGPAVASVSVQLPRIEGEIDLFCAFVLGQIS